MFSAWFNAEGDNLPGLIIDFYNGVIVMQMHSVGMYRMRNDITSILIELLGERLVAVYDKSESTIPFMSGIKPKAVSCTDLLSQSLLLRMD